MGIPEEIIDMIVKEVMKELEEASKKSGKPITFDDIEGKMLEVRHRIGEMMMQKAVENQAEMKTPKKTARAAKANSKTKVSKKRK